MEMLIDDSAKAAFGSLFSFQPLDVPEFELGETRPISVALVKQIASPIGSRLFDSEDLTGYTFRAAIGVGFTAPVAGSFTLTFGANTTTALAYNSTAQQIEDALNLLASVISAGGLDVELEGGGSGFFIVTFRAAGARAEMTGDATNLAPLSDIDFGTLVDGSSTLKEVQSLRVSQSPATWVDLTATSTAAAAPVTVAQAGGGGLNAKVRVTISPLPYDGKWSMTVAGIESALVDFDARESALQTALENISISNGLLVTGRKYKIVSFATGDDFTNVGAASNATAVVFVASGTTPTTWTHGSVLSPVAAGNVTVSKEAVGQYLIAFQGDMTNTAMGTITADASALLTVIFKSGNLPLDVPGIELLLGGEPNKTVEFAVRAIPPGGSSRVIYRRDVTLRDTIFTPASETPQPRLGYYTSAQIDARFQNKITGDSVWANVANGGTYIYAGVGDSPEIVDSAITVNISNLGTDDFSLYDTTAHNFITISPGEMVNFTTVDAGGGDFTFTENARVSLLQASTLVAAFAAANLSTLPTSNPGGGKPWLNGGVMQVGA